MKKLPLTVLLILLGPLSAYIGMYSKITCKPSQAGFWIIIALGMAIGVSISLIAQRIRAKNNPPRAV
ncbi:MAG: hypothetical protein PHT35_09185 [Bacteroidales bacterium]|nr:hypothetical protein [Bacteroidales bacterium]MDD3522695.1 hypothetical protein [Bacteroidales bacterium]MDD4031456.1 hypothetical protein [Bacteroidales bacterium]MDD4435897.1 hypothetical protein [Bacteroidales bacterium]